MRLILVDQKAELDIGQPEVVLTGALAALHGCSIAAQVLDRHVLIVDVHHFLKALAKVIEEVFVHVLVNRVG